MSKNTDLGNLVNGLFVSSTRNVGIGTTTPLTNLMIGDGAAQQQPYLSLARNSTGGFFAGVRWYDGTTIKSYIQEDADFNLRFGTNNTERMRITPLGNIIQYVNDGSFSIYRTDGTTLKASLANPDGSNTDEGALYLYKNNALKVQLRANGVSYFSGGNVGIGASTSPAYLLEASTSGGSQRIRVGTLQNNNNTSTFEAITTSTINTASSGWIRANAGGTMSIGTSSYTKANGDSGNFANLSAEVQTLAMTVNGANVGVGGTAPKTRLQVSAAVNGYQPALGTIDNTTSLYITNTDFAYGMIIGSRPDGNSYIQVQRTDGNTTAYSLILQPNGGSVSVIGSLSKGSGSFRIEHPLKPDTHQLVHSFIEGPQADLIYRGKLNLVNGKAQANIDEVSTMTEGTFNALCRDVQCFTTNENGWDLIKGKVIGNILYIESQNQNSTDEISWMVIGERKDKHMMDTEWTDDNGKVIVEPIKELSAEVQLLKNK